MKEFDHAQVYDAIVELYDMAETLLDAIEEGEIAHAEEHLGMIIPVIDQLEESANILTEEYYAISKEGKAFDQHSKRTIETALRKMFLAINDCKTKMAHFAKEGEGL